VDEMAAAAWIDPSISPSGDGLMGAISTTARHTNTLTWSEKKNPPSQCSRSKSRWIWTRKILPHVRRPDDCTDSEAP